jgi:NAD(P)-dependent dehydrogenase (short-subunit alcohol dehydrogenase family)
MNKDLGSQTAIVTGASHGIGRAIALSMARQARESCWLREKSMTSKPSHAKFEIMAVKL